MRVLAVEHFVVDCIPLCCTHVTMHTYSVSSTDSSFSSSLILPIPRCSTWWRRLHCNLEEEEGQLREKVGSVLTHFQLMCSSRQLESSIVYLHNTQSAILVKWFILTVAPLQQQVEWYVQV